MKKAQIGVPISSPEDPRLGNLMGQGEASRETRIVLLGFPTDVGVRRNGGRAGATEGPNRIRHFFYRLTPPAELLPEFMRLLAGCIDLGNYPVTEDLDQDQQGLGDVLAPHLAEGRIPIVLGGGHETSYGHFLGYAQNQTPVSIVNFDAHTDVRSLKEGQGHSGSPFRQAIGHPSGCCTGYSVLGLLPQSTAGAHLDIVRSHGCYVWGSDLTLERIEAELSGPQKAMVTIDLDVLDQSYAPGVSAPAAGGLHPDLLFRAARLAGRTRSVSSLDIVEVNPLIDLGDQTSRLAAVLLWQFLAGLAERGD